MSIDGRRSRVLPPRCCRLLDRRKKLAFRTPQRVFLTALAPRRHVALGCLDQIQRRTATPWGMAVVLHQISQFRIYFVHKAFLSIVINVPLGTNDQWASPHPKLWSVYGSFHDWCGQTAPSTKCSAEVGTAKWGCSTIQTGNNWKQKMAM